ncbi:MAG TPA: DAK2 domain-containing protein, partial [Micromonospora sp.]
GAALAALGRSVGDARPDATTVAAGVRAGYVALTTLGGAKPGDKTMLDALLPFTETLETAVAAGSPLTVAWAAATDAASTAATDTARLRPPVGRARPLAEKSIGTPDAGALSMAICLRAVGTVLEGHQQ